MAMELIALLDSDAIGSQEGYLFSLIISDRGRSRQRVEMVVDTQDFPHAVTITTAEVTDRKGALEAMERNLSNLQQVQSVLVDGGYTGQPFVEAVQEKLHATVQVVKRNELHTFAVLPQRWVVERSFGWLEKKSTLMEELRA